MICCFCHFSNLDGDHRCLRCGRRLPEEEGSPYRYAATRPALAYGSASVAGNTSQTVPVDSFDSNPNQRPLANYAAAVQNTLSCEAPLANPIHRLLAFATDVSITLCGVGIFFAILLLMGVPVEFSKQTVPIYGGATFLVGFFYQAIWAIANVDSPGCQWTKLELLDFDGHTAGSKTRWRRLFCSYLSLFSAGLGILWSLVDEDGLSWHDYMSESFLTPYPEQVKQL